MKASDRVEILFEDMNGKVDAIMEYARDIPAMKDDISVLKTDVHELKFDGARLKGGMQRNDADHREFKTELRLMREVVIEDSVRVDRLVKAQR